MTFVSRVPARCRATLVFFSFLLASCGGGGGSSGGGASPTTPAATPSEPGPAPTAVAGVNITTESLVATAGGPEVTLTASTDASGPVTWTLEAGSPGRLDSTVGIMVHYVPPPADSVDADTVVGVVAMAGGSTKKITLVLEGGNSLPPAPPPVAPPATLSVEAGSNSIVAGGSGVALSASPPAPSDTVTWSLEPGSPGSLSAGSGTSTIYLPPAAATTDTQATIVATAGGQTRKTTILVQGAQGLSLIAGNDAGPGLRDGAGAAARFYAPQGVVRDSGGNLYVADSSNHTIRKIAPDTTVTTLAGMAGVAGHRDGTGAAARLTAPRHLAIDGAGNLYVTDGTNHTVRRITPAGVVSTIAGTPGVKGNVDGIGGSAQFNNPSGIAADATGRLYVADAFNSLIRTVSPGGLVGTYAGIRGQRALVNGSTSTASFIDPMALTLDVPGNVYVSDGYFSPPEPNTIAGRSIIRKITRAGQVSSLAGGFIPETADSVDGTGADARFWGISGMTADAAGNLYAGDGRIRRITPAGVVSTYLARGAGQLNFAGGMTVAADGTLYFADLGDHVVRALDPSGAIETLAGSAPRTGSADGPGASAQFNNPDGIAADAAGNLFLADRFNQTIRRVSATGVVTTIAGSARDNGSADGAGSAARFYFPADVVADAAGNLYVADSQNATIRKISAAGVVSTLAGSPGQTGSTDGEGTAARFWSPQGIAIDKEGNLYVSEPWNYVVRKITPSGVVTTLAGQAGQYGVADGAGAQARFGGPGDLTVDDAGNVYVLDAGSTVRRITPAGAVTTLAGVAGQHGDADGAGSEARFSSPQGIAIDGAGNLYVADTDNNAVRRVTPAGVVTTVAGHGAPGQLAQASLFRPRRLVVTGDRTIALTSVNGVFRLSLP